MDEEDKKARDSLLRINKVCKLLNIAMKTVFAIYCVWWIATSILMTSSLASPNQFYSAKDVGLVELLLYLLGCGALAALFVVLIQIFSDASNGHSPFSMRQVKRLRCISLFLTLYFFADLAVSFYASIVHFGGVLNVANGAVITFNFGPLIAASVIFAFSFVFKYGVLLQEFSDETL